MSVLSLYIPIISESTSEEYIIKMFKNHNIGKVMRVDFVKNKAKNRREAFIHFDEWFNSEESEKIKNDVLNPNTKTKFKYTESGKFWPLLINKNAHKRVNNPNYEVLNKSEIKTVYKSTIIIDYSKNKDKNKESQNKNLSNKKTKI